MGAPAVVSPMVAVKPSVISDIGTVVACLSRVVHEGATPSFPRRSGPYPNLPSHLQCAGPVMGACQWGTP